MISSPNNPTIKRARRLRKRAERLRRRAFIAEGHRALRAALETCHPVEVVLCSPSGESRHHQLLVDARDAGAKIVTVTPEVLAVLSSAANPPDLVAVAALPELRPQGTGPALVLAAVRDPATVGALLASAAASGVPRVIASRGTTDLFASTPVRIAAGAHFSLVLSEGETLEESLAALPRPVVALVEQGPPPWQASLGASPTLVVGEEPPAVYDARVAVPSGPAGMQASLAVRGAVLMFEARRQREGTA